MTTTTRLLAAASPTKTGGFTSRAKRMDLAREILESAKPSAGNQSWFSALSEEHQSAILEVRDSWRKTSEATGVSASQMAKTIIEKLSARGYKVAKYRQVQRWLTQG
jgi:hypothetical protein